MPNLSPATYSSLDPDPFGYTPPSVSGGNYTAPPPPQPVYQPPVIDPYVGSQALPEPSYAPPPQYQPAPIPYAAPAPPQPYYAPAPTPYLDQQFAQETQGMYNPAPPVYVPQPYQSQAQQYVLGAGAQNQGDLEYITGVADATNYQPTYADLGKAQGRYQSAYDLYQGDQSFTDYAGQQNAAQIRNTYDLAMPGPDGQPAVHPEYAQYLFEHDIAPRANDLGGYDFTKVTRPSTVRAPLDFLSTFGSAEESFGIPKLDVPILGDIGDAALSPLSLVGAGSGLVTGGLTGIAKTAATRGIPAIAGSVVSSEGARAGLEAVDAPGWLQETGAFAGGLVGGGIGWQTPELARVGAGAGKAVGGALRDLPENIARANTPRMPIDVQLERGAINPETGRGFDFAEVGGGSTTPSGPRLSDEGAAVGAKITAALQQETQIRRSGVAAEEIHAGRVRQTAGVREGFNDALGMGKTADETVAALREGARTGKLRQTVADPIDLSEAERLAAINDINKHYGAKGQELTGLNLTLALDGLIRGEGIQPKQIEKLGELFGPEFVKAAKAANAGRPSIVAELDDTARARIKARGELEKKQYRESGEAIARQEEIAAAQAKLANELQAQAHLNPTNKRAQQLADDARARGQKAANEADRLEAQLAQRAWDDLAAKRQREARTGAEKAAKAASKEAEAADKLNPDLMADARRMLGEDPLKTSAVNREALTAIETWIKSQDVLTQGIGEVKSRQLANVRALLSGNLADSYATSLVTQRNILENALLHTGVDPTVAKKVADVLLEREIKLRYPDSTPRSVQVAQRNKLAAQYRKDGLPAADAMAKATDEVAARFGTSERAQRLIDMIQGAKDEPNRATAGIAAASQEIKNTMFGIGDFAITLINIPKAMTTAGPSILAGGVNRLLTALHSPLAAQIGTEGLSRRTSSLLDGVIHSNNIGSVDLTNPKTNTLFAHIPGIGGPIDRGLVRAAEALTKLQYGVIMGTLRDLNYEGNLALLKLTGQDIASPAVRKVAADAANAHTLAARAALRQGRAAAEQAVAISPSMRRAQIAEILQVGKLLNGTGAERILAAMTITSVVGTTLAMGKVLNDLVGIGDFEMDPSKPGFGQITFPGGRVMSLFPQSQIATTIARSVRVLAEGDPEDAKDAWTRFFLGSSSTPVSTAAKAAGFGYKPGEGWQLGNYDPSWQDLMLGIAPPIAQQVAREGLDPVKTPLGLLGGNVFDENKWAAADRVLGRPYLDWLKQDRDAATAALEQADPGLAKRFRDDEADKVKAGQSALQNDPAVRSAAFDAAGDQRVENSQQYAADLELAASRFRMGGETQGDGAKLREDIADAGTVRNARRLATDTVFKQVFDLYKSSGTLPDDPLKAADVQWFAVDDEFRDPITGKIKSDQYEAYKAAQDKLLSSFDDKQRAHILDYQYAAQGLPPEVQQYYDDLKRIEASGYYDRASITGEPQTAVAWRDQHPQIDALLRTYGYGENTTKVIDERNKLRQEQVEADTALTAGKITPEQWLDGMHQRQDMLRGAKEAIYAGATAQQMGALDGYFNAIDAADTGGVVDWEQVDRWVASQPKSVQDAINNRTRETLSPKVAEYYADMAKVEEKGYFESRDDVFTYWLEATENTEFTGTQREYWNSVRSDYLAYAEEYLDANAPGWRQSRPQSAQDLANTAYESLYAKFQKGVSDTNAWWRFNNPEEAELVRKWGLGGTGKEEINYVIGQTTTAGR